MKKSTPILVTGLIILGIVAAFLGFELNTSSKQNEAYSNEINDMNAMMEGNGMSDLVEGNLKASLNNLLDEYNSVTTNNQELNDSIEKQKEKVTLLLEGLKQSEAKRNSSEKRRRYTARELNKIQNEAATLRKVMKNYVYKVDSLNTLNKELQATIVNKNNKITEVSGQRDVLQKQTDDLSKTVELGSKIQILNLKAEAIRIRNSGSFTETTRARRADQVRACFTIVDNKIAVPGPKTFYLRVTDPEGKLMMSSKSTKINVGDESLDMSIARTVDYQNAAVDLCIFYEKADDSFSKGDYKVEIYTEDGKVGTTSFGLK